MVRLSNCRHKTLAPNNLVQRQSANCAVRLPLTFVVRRRNKE